MGFLQLNDGFVVVGYHLSDVNDFIGTKHFSNIGTVIFSTGKLSNCAILGSTNSSKYLYYGSDYGISLSGNCGCSIWIYLQTNPGSGAEFRFIDWRSSISTGRYLLVNYKNDSGTYKFHISAGGADTSWTYELTLNKWYKVDVTLESGGLCYLYVNGSFIGTGNRGTSSNSTNKITVGAEIAGLSGYYWKGNLDEAMFYNRHRTAKEIKNRYLFEMGMLV